MALSRTATLAIIVYYTLRPLCVRLVNFRRYRILIKDKFHLSRAVSDVIEDLIRIGQVLYSLNKSLINKFNYQLIRKFILVLIDN